MNLEGTLIGNAKARLRLLAGSNAFLWQTYMRLVGKPLPNPRQIDLIVEGYPRSGNTYAEHMLRIMCPGLRWISHTHSQGTLLWAEKHKIPSLVIIREPEDAVISLFLFHMFQVSIRNCFYNWIQFYQTARSCGNVSFIWFNSLICDTENTILKGLGAIGLENRSCCSLPSNPYASFEKSHDHDKRHLEKVWGIVAREEQGNRPSETRSEIKRQILDELLSQKNSGTSFLIQKCRKEYALITKNCLLL